VTACFDFLATAGMLKEFVDKIYKEPKGSSSKPRVEAA
jgi:hypothetical protein